MLELHTATDLEDLADALAGVLSVPAGDPKAADPMAAELVAVPSAGLRTWLPLQLARRLGRSTPHRSDGVAANIEFPFPGVLGQRVVQAHRVDGGESPDDPDPWEVERLVWAVLEVCGGWDGPGSLPRGLTEFSPGSSRYAAARQVSDLFDRYHLHRPAMVRSWERGADVDDAGAGLAPSQRWQPALWRVVRGRLGLPSPPERLAEALAGVADGSLEVDLPERLAVFGMSLLPGGPGFLDLARALGEQRDVHLFVVEPSGRLGERFRAALASDGRGVGHPSGHRLRAEVDPADSVEHPLLRSWGRLHYETASLLEDARRAGRFSGTAPSEPDPVPGPDRIAGSTGRGEAGSGNERGEAGSGDEPGRTTLLAALQAGLRADRAPAGDHVPSEEDDSVSFHACHGPSRQVEVLHDTILGLLTRHPHLQEDDILVVCPDLEAFAPLIEATFGPSAHTGTTVPTTGTAAVGEPGSPESARVVPLGPEAGVKGRPSSDQEGADGGGRPRLRYRLADRSLGSSAPLVGAFRALLELIDGRFDAPAVLDFLNLEPVRRRAGLSEDDLATVTDWVLDLHVRWGLHPEDRERHGVPSGVTTNTWRAGLDRILLGAAVGGAAERAVASGGTGPPGSVPGSLGGTIPHGIEGSDTEVAGRLAAVLWRLADLAEASRSSRPIDEWVGELVAAASGLLAVPRDQQWQLDRLLDGLGRIVDSAGWPPCGAPLTLTDVRRLVSERLDPVEGRPSFFRGGVTVSSLTPLRWVPHRVIVMLGMDAAALSAGPADGDDLAALSPVVGDRDRRSELRQALLETVLSATEHLVILRDGHDVRTNQVIAAPVAVAELRDALAAMVDPAGRREWLEGHELDHPRQPYDEAYFAPDGPRGTDAAAAAPRMPRSFDLQAGAAAIARRRGDDGTAEFLAEPLPEVIPPVVALEDLHRFFRSPIRFFLERRLELRLPRGSDAPVGILDMKMTGLPGYASGDRLLRRVLASGDVDAAVEAWADLERRTGVAPPGRAGDHALRKIEWEVRRIWTGAHALGVGAASGEADDVGVDIPLSDGTRVVGRVRTSLAATPEDPRGGPAEVSYTKRRSAHVLSTWVDLAALTLADPEPAWRAVLATKADKGATNAKEFGSSQKIDQAAVTAYELDPADSGDSAHRALECAVDLYRRGLREPLPVFRRVSEALLRRPERAPDWPGRFPESEEQLVYGHLDARALLELPVRPQDPPGAAADRTRRFAEYLFGTLDATMQEVGS